MRVNQMDHDIPKDKQVSVVVVLKGVHAKRLEDSCDESDRSLRREARLRLEDHLNSYSNIASIGNNVKR
ncbi:TraY domain-containing protein [Vibrio sp. ER1A]|uniref:TraY domain-containing protein n=1 Tax=Vibrio sp. ER1A TaxID=1517681 RepID=UPI002E0EDA16